jgi:uncharacterized protein
MEKQMLYLRICRDKPGAIDLRETHRPEHRAYLRSGVMKVLQAGPMCVGDKNDTNVGSFMIVEANSRAEVQEFHDNDPFSKVGLYGEVIICRWDKHIG